MLKELKEMEPVHYIVAITTILALIGPGFLCIFYYRNALISSLDVFKLLIFSSSITLPLIILNFCILAIPILGVANKPSNIHPSAIWVVAAILTAAAFYVALYASFLWHMSFRRFTFMLAGIEVFVAVVSYGIGFWVEHKKRVSAKCSEEALDSSRGALPDEPQGK